MGREYPRRVKSIPLLIAAVGSAKANPTTFQVKPDWCTLWNAEEFLRWFRRCLNDKINRNEPARRGRKDDPDYQLALKRDQDIVRRPYGGSQWGRKLTVPEIRRRFPAIVARENRWDDY